MVCDGPHKHDKEELIFPECYLTTPFLEDFKVQSFWYFVRWYSSMAKKNIYVHSLCVQYRNQSPGSINYLKYIITPGTLPLTAIKPLNTTTIPHGWNKIQLCFCFCRCLLLMKHIRITSRWITGGVIHGVYCDSMNIRRK